MDKVYVFLADGFETVEALAKAEAEAAANAEEATEAPAEEAAEA